ncbi:MAG: hypothetical protein R3A10_09060 [Caldilineaceae bacterium]
MPWLAPAAPAEPSGPVVVFGAYATAIEEPWDGVIHTALNQAQEAGRIAYTYTDDIGYSGDMERILREVAEETKPAVIFGDAFGNEEAVRRVAKDYPEIALRLRLRRRPGRTQFLRLRQLDPRTGLSLRHAGRRADREQHRRRGGRSARARGEPHRQRLHRRRRRSGQP